MAIERVKTVTRIVTFIGPDGEVDQLLKESNLYELSKMKVGNVQMIVATGGVVNHDPTKQKIDLRPKD